MASVEGIMKPAELGPDVSWHFMAGLFQVFDHAEGESLRFTTDEVVALIAEAIAGEEPVTREDRCLAVNVFANRNDSGLASFLAFQFP